MITGNQILGITILLHNSVNLRIKGNRALELQLPLSHLLTGCRGCHLLLETNLSCTFDSIQIGKCLE
jgi:hypothetical protein